MEKFNNYIITVKGNYQFEFVGRNKTEYSALDCLVFEDEKGKILNFNPKYIVCIEVF